MQIDEAQLRHAFKHAKDFGIVDGPSKQTLADFAAKIEAHMAAPATRAINQQLQHVLTTGALGGGP